VATTSNFYRLNFARRVRGDMIIYTRPARRERISIFRLHVSRAYAAVHVQISYAFPHIDFTLIIRPRCRRSVRGRTKLYSLFHRVDDNWFYFNLETGFVRRRAYCVCVCVCVLSNVLSGLKEDWNRYYTDPRLTSARLLCITTINDNGLGGQKNPFAYTFIIHFLSPAIVRRGFKTRRFARRFSFARTSWPFLGLYHRSCIYYYYAAWAHEIWQPVSFSAPSRTGRK